MNIILWKTLSNDRLVGARDWAGVSCLQCQPGKRIFEGSQDIDILLTDIEMPRETGLQLVEWLHENNFHPIVLVLTGHQRFDYAQEALNLHIFSYLLKPIDPDQLMEKAGGGCAGGEKKMHGMRKSGWIWKSTSPPMPRTRSASSRTISVRIFRSWTGPHLHRRENPHEPGLPVPHFSTKTGRVAQ